MTAPFDTWAGKQYASKHPVAIAMTLCIAAVAESGAIVLVSDRMVSVGANVRVSTPITKLYGLHHSIALLYAGGVQLAQQIVEMTGDAITAKWGANTEGPTVREAAQVYRQQYERLLAEEAPHAVLPNFFIPSIEEYYARRATLPRAIVKEIEEGIADFRFDPDEDPRVIVAGIDATGPHIYVVNGNTISAGERSFAAIGATAAKADAILREHYSPHRSFNHTMMCVYAAKRKAESRKYGVGKETDIHIVGPEPRRCRQDDGGTRMMLRAMYDGVKKKRRPVRDAIDAYDSLTPPSPAQGTPASPPRPDSTHDR
jgi:20S proteasome alpha/beta subunit